MKTAIFDMDSIIVDLFTPWLAWYNKKAVDNVTVDDLKSWHIHDHIKPEWKKDIYKFFTPSNRYKKAPIIEGAVEGLKKLHDEGVEIVIATAVAGRSADAKYHLMKKAAPFIPEDDIFIGKKKEKLAGDFFIDDSPSNILKYKERWVDAHLLTIAYPYNQNLKDQVDLYAESYKDTKKAWTKIVEYILDN